MSDLIVIGYPDETTAYNVWDELVKFLEALKPYGGAVLQTSLSHDAEQELMKALHGEDRSAPTWEQPRSAGATAS